MNPYASQHSEHRRLLAQFERVSRTGRGRSSPPAVAPRRATPTNAVDESIARLERRSRLDALYEAVDRSDVPSANRQLAEAFCLHAAAWLGFRAPRVEWFRPASTSTGLAFILDGSVADGERVFDASQAPIPRWSAPTGFCAAADVVHVLAHLLEEDLVDAIAHEICHAHQFSTGNARPGKLQEQQAHAFGRAVKAWWSEDLRTGDRLEFVMTKPRAGRTPARLQARLELEEMLASERA